ncbi:MAG: thioredoxin-disulfide reductase [Acutalibacteraceae bacterium]
MEHIYDTVILGGGPAGYTAALYAARAGLNTVLLEKMSPGGQMALTGEIDNYPGFETGIDGFTLGMKMQKAAQSVGAETQYAEVTGTDLSDKVKSLQTAKGIYRAKTVILSTGAAPRPLGLEGEQSLLGRGVHYCAHCDGRFYKGKIVAVVGGGNSAAADALYLAGLAEKVYVLHRRDILRCAQIYRNALQHAKNVQILFNCTVAAWITEGKLTGIQVQNTLTGNIFPLRCDGVFVSIGRTPVTGFLSGAVALDENGYILADESTKTSVPGVFAAGDVRTKLLRQVVTAAADGAVAAHCAEMYLRQI